MSNEKITAWVTKYALTTGIEVVEGEVYHDISASTLCYGCGCFAHGKEWHRTVEAARARAQEMRVAKIASLRKTIARLERLDFTAPNTQIQRAP